jgi:hypothetical protein
MIGRRRFITLLGGAAVAWSLWLVVALRPKIPTIVQSFTTPCNILRKGCSCIKKRWKVVFVSKYGTSIVVRNSTYSLIIHFLLHQIPLLVICDHNKNNC